MKDPKGIEFVWPTRGSLADCLLLHHSDKQGVQRMARAIDMMAKASKIISSRLASGEAPTRGEVEDFQFYLDCLDNWRDSHLNPDNEPAPKPAPPEDEPQTCRYCDHVTSNSSGVCHICENE